MNRRGFLTGMGGILLAGAAPAIVRADSLMRIVPLDTTIIGADFGATNPFDVVILRRFGFHQTKSDPLGQFGYDIELRVGSAEYEKWVGHGWVNGMILPSEVVR